MRYDRCFLFIALSLFSCTVCRAAVPNVEIYNSTDVPVFYTMGNEEKHPFAVPVKKLNLKTSVQDTIDPLKPIELLMVAKKEPSEGDPVKVYFLKQERARFANIYVEVVVDPQGELRIVPQAGRVSKGKLPIKNNIQPKNITVKRGPFTSSEHAAPAPVSAVSAVVSTIVKSSDGATYVKKLVDNNLENFRRLAREAKFDPKKIKPLVATESQNFVRAFAQKGITSASLPEIESYVADVFEQAVGIIQKTDRLLQSPAMREKINKEIKAAEAMFASLRSMNDEGRQAALTKKAEEIAQKVTSANEKAYVSQIVPEIYHSLRNQYVLYDAVKDIKKDVAIKPVDVPAVDTWFSTKLPEAISAISKLPGHNQQGAARDAAHTLTSEYVQQVTGYTPAEFESRFRDAIMREVKDVAVSEKSPVVKKAEQQVERVAAGSFLDQIQKASLRHVEQEAKELISEAEKQKLRDLPEAYLDEEMSKLRQENIRASTRVRLMSDTPERRILKEKIKKNDAYIMFMESLQQVEDEDPDGEWD